MEPSVYQRNPHLPRTFFQQEELWSEQLVTAKIEYKRMNRFMLMCAIFDQKGKLHFEYDEIDEPQSAFAMTELLQDVLMPIWTKEKSYYKWSTRADGIQLFDQLVEEIDFLEIALGWKVKTPEPTTQFGDTSSPPPTSIHQGLNPGSSSSLREKLKQVSAPPDNNTHQPGDRVRLSPNGLPSRTTTERQSQHIPAVTPPEHDRVTRNPRPTVEVEVMADGPPNPITRVTSPLPSSPEHRTPDPSLFGLEFDKHYITTEVTCQPQKPLAERPSKLSKLISPGSKKSWSRCSENTNQGFQWPQVFKLIDSPEYGANTSRPAKKV
ncbi:hypothetical protein DFH27DRAFT_616095 [Peziza echinospora]|nr:hypothetical protein DFH27DRAFT_616095 [Peziza echinospora]